MGGIQPSPLFARLGALGGGHPANFHVPFLAAWFDPEDAHWCTALAIMWGVRCRWSSPMGVAMDGEKVHADCARRRMSDVTESVRVLSEPRVQQASGLRTASHMYIFH